MENGVSKDIQNLNQAQESSAPSAEEMLQKNLELTQEIFEMTKKIKRHITFQKIFSLIYFLIIIVPIILSIIYLPPLLKNAFGPYMELLDTDKGDVKLDIGNVNMDELQKLLK